MAICWSRDRHVVVITAYSPVYKVHFVLIDQWLQYRILWGRISIESETPFTPFKCSPVFVIHSMPLSVSCTRPSQPHNKRLPLLFQIVSSSSSGGCNFSGYLRKRVVGSRGPLPIRTVVSSSFYLLRQTRQKCSTALQVLQRGSPEILQPFSVQLSRAFPLE